MKRIGVEELPQKEVIVVSRVDYDADRKRGFAVLEYAPKGKLILRNHRNPAQQIERDVPEVLMFRCMRCQYDALDTAYTPDPKDAQQVPRRGLELIKAHVDRGIHPWAYTPFDSPYGNVQDVIIEGVEDYTKET